MITIRHLIVTALIAALFVPDAHAQAPGSPFRIDTTKYVLQPARPIAAQMHPAAKGAIIGGAAGAGTWLAIGVWYCTIGPHEAGECGSSSTWLQGIPLFAAIGAGVGALIGAAKR
jgi:hypothetical protein